MAEEKPLTQTVMKNLSFCSISNPSIFTQTRWTQSVRQSRIVRRTAKWSNRTATCWKSCNCGMFSTSWICAASVCVPPTGHPSRVLCREILTVCKTLHWSGIHNQGLYLNVVIILRYTCGVHAFDFISNTFISNSGLKMAYFEKKNRKIYGELISKSFANLFYSSLIAI